MSMVKKVTRALSKNEYLKCENKINGNEVYAYKETSLRYIYIYIYIYINKSNGDEIILVSSTSHKYLSYILLEGKWLDTNQIPETNYL